MLDKNLLKARIAFARSGGETLRYHTHRMATEDRVNGHSFNAAWLVIFMTPGMAAEDQLALIKAALAHDLAEHKTGDLPSPAKRALGVREQFHAYEMAMLDDVGLNFEHTLTAAHKRILKLADVMDGCFHCIEERSLGNVRIADEIWPNFRNYLAELNPTGPIEEGITEYIDELWAKYGEAR